MRGRSSRFALAATLQAGFLSALLVLSSSGEVMAWAWVLLMSAWAGGEAAAQEVDDRADPADLASGLGAALLLLVVVGSAWTPSVTSETARVFGLGLLLGGVALRVWAVAALGRHFRARPSRKGDDVVRRGPYARFRHPAELGLLAICWGTALGLGSVFGLAVCAALVVPVTWWRIEREEGEMLRGPAGKYADYTKQVSRWGLLAPRA